MKNYTLRLIIIFIIIISFNKTYALSDKFQFVIETIGIPRYNTYGNEINEDVYYTYNVFSYGEPSTIKDKSQRWKNSKYGFWTKTGGSYKGIGTRGEYYVLGQSYSGAVIYNYYFPMDAIPSTAPETWLFYNYPDAAASWKDASKYKYMEQLEHMKTSKLMFNDISSRAKADNPKYIREYNLTANQIGLSKARLDAAATWKTNGMISTRRKISGVIYAQVYLIKPMSAEANVKSEINVSKQNILKETEDELIIPVDYKTKVVNMTGFAREEHIKEIKASLYINGKKIDEVSGSKIISVGNKYMLVITREQFPQNINHSVEISVDGYMHTEFVVDGLLQNVAKETINVYVEPKLIVPVKESNLKILEKDALNWVVRPLAQTYDTVNESAGFIEAGKSLIIKLKLNIDKNDIKNVQAKINNMLIDVYKYDEAKDLVLKIELPKTLKTTLYGQYSLREKYDDFYLVSNNDIGMRKNPPHILEIAFNCFGKKYSEKIKFDTLDTFLSNINTKLKRTMSEQINNIKLEDWINSDE